MGVDAYQFAAREHLLVSQLTDALKVRPEELTDRVAYIEAMNAGRGIGVYAPRDPGAEEVRAMFDELITLAGGKV